MKELRLRPSAQRDLNAIWDYTAQSWGLDQAKAYLATLRRDMGRLCEFPGLGAEHPSRHARFRKLPSGHHFIYFLITKTNVDVVRVLHERMDVTRHLPG